MTIPLYPQLGQKTSSMQPKATGGTPLHAALAWPIATGGQTLEPSNQQDSLLVEVCPNQAEGLEGLPPSGGAPLSWLNSNNSNELPFDSLNNTNSPYHKKLAKALEMNVLNWISCIGKDHVGFLTLTFKANIVDKKEADRRFNSFATGVLGKYIGAWVKVCERQKRGAWHFHLLIDCRADIKTGYNPKKGKRKRSANEALRNLWQILGEKYESYGFGFRSELEPMKANGEAISRYVSKYIGKHLTVRRKEDRGMRLISYSRDFPRVWRMGFMFLSPGSKLWRRKLSDIAQFLGAKNLDELVEMIGEKWAFMLRPVIARWVYNPGNYENFREYEMDYYFAEVATGWERVTNTRGKIIGWQFGTEILDQKAFYTLLNMQAIYLLKDIDLAKIAA